MSRIPTIPVAALAVTASIAACYNAQLMIKNARPKIVSDHDKFRGVNSIRLEPMTVQGGSADRLEISAFCGSPAEQPSIFACYLDFTGYSADWRFLKLRDVNALVDGVRLPLGDAERDGETRTYINPVNGAPGVAVTERLSVPISLEHLRLLASAQQTEFQVGFLEFALPPQHKQGLTDLLAALGPDPTDGRAKITAQDSPTPWLGARLGPPPAALDGSLPSGATVLSVTPGSPADTGGLKAGDVILSCDGRPVVSAVAFRASLPTLLKMGVATKLAVRRDGAGLELTVTPTAKPASSPSDAKDQNYEN